MPIYEYEPLDRECVICNGRVEVLQGVDEAPCEFCPTCGLSVRRVVSRASFGMRRAVNPDQASAKGFTTYRRAEKGRYEKIAGDGPDAFASPEAPPKAPKKVIDLDADP